MQFEYILINVLSIESIDFHQTDEFVYNNDLLTTSNLELKIQLTIS